MVNESILGGLKSALVRNQSLKHAMMTFFNAGYKKQEIIEAAQVLKESKFSTKLKELHIDPVKTARTLPERKQPIKKPKPKKVKPVKPVKIKPVKQKPVKPKKIKPVKQEVSQYEKPKEKIKPVKQKQAVSKYEQPKKKPNGKVVIIIPGILLVILVLVLVAIFLFKEELINFFRNLLG